METVPIKENHQIHTSDISERKKIMIGIFSYNEGKNLEGMYNQTKNQCIGLHCEIVLIDESDEQKSLSIVNKIK